MVVLLMIGMVVFSYLGFFLGSLIDMGAEDLSLVFGLVCGLAMIVIIGIYLIMDKQRVILERLQKIEERDTPPRASPRAEKPIPPAAKEEAPTAPKEAAPPEPKTE